MWENILQHTHHIISILIIAILAKLLPSSQKREHEKYYDLHTLEKEYQKYDWLSLVAICVFAPMVIVAFYFFLEFATNLIHPPQNPQFVNPPINIQIGDNNVTICICIFFTFLLSLTNIFLKAAMGLDKFEIYGIYGEMKYGIDSQKAEKWWIGLFGVLSIVFLVYSNDWYIKFEDKKIEYSTFPSLESNTYSYSDLDSLKLIIRKPRGPIFKGDESYSLKFKDNNDLNLNWIMDKNIKPSEIINFISLKSKMKIVTIIVY